MMVTIFDYGAGNLHSLAKALERADADVRVSSSPHEAVHTDVLVLPGVGGFGYAAERLGGPRGEIAGALRDGLPTIGICLGMQLLFDRSEEGPGEGLGLLAGDVRRLNARRVPHIGWNAIEEARGTALRSLGAASVYYANSFVCRPATDEVVSGWTVHETDRFPAAVRAGAIIGVQFHPEKSSHSGVTLLGALLREVAA